MDSINEHGIISILSQHGRIFESLEAFQYFKRDGNYVVYFIPEFPRKEDDSCFQIGAEFGMYCKKLLVEVYNRVYNHKTLQEEDKSLIVIHGPIVYVDNKDDYFNRYDYEDGTRSVMSLFVKDFKFTIEQEYRFVILPCEEPILDQVILPISDLFRGCFFLPWETTLA